VVNGWWPISHHGPERTPAHLVVALLPLERAERGQQGLREAALRQL
jgi:hypothetical protein